MTALNSSTVAYAQFRNLQKDHIRANLARKAQQEGREEDELDSDARSISAEELDDDEYREHEEWRPVTQVLQMVKPVETRWNSTMFMVQRWVPLLGMHFAHIPCPLIWDHAIEMQYFLAPGHFVYVSL